MRQHSQRRPRASSRAGAHRSCHSDAAWPRCTSRQGKREVRRRGEPQLWPSAGVHAQARLETRLQALQEERNRNAAPSADPSQTSMRAALRFGRHVVSPSAAAERLACGPAAERQALRAQRQSRVLQRCRYATAARSPCGHAEDRCKRARSERGSHSLRCVSAFRVSRVRQVSVDQAVAASRANDDAHAQQMRMLVQSAHLSGHTELERCGFADVGWHCCVQHRTA